MKSKLIAFTAGLALAITGGLLAATFNQFTPATGVLVGNANSPVTTAATNANIISLWSGTCNASSFLRGDGSCQSPAGAGTVTSVALAAPTGFSVTGSPITSNGTLTLSTALSGLINGTGSGFANATSANVTAEFSGTCNSTTFLRGDGTCNTPAGTTVGANPTASVGLTAVNGVATTFLRSDAAPALSLGGTSAQYLRGDTTLATFPAIPAGANPTGTIGLTAVNGVATTFLRSDGAPALSQAIAPTWTGRHIFSLTSTGTNGDGAVAAASARPTFSARETDAAADNRTWIWGADGEQFLLQAVNDANTVVGNALIINRTGTTIDSIAATGTFTATGVLRTTQGVVAAQGPTTGVSNTSYVSFQDSTATEIGYVGKGSASNADIALVNNVSGGHVDINAGTGGLVRAGGLPIARSATALKLASGYTTNTGGTLTNLSGITSVTANGSGNYTVDYTAAGFASRPACTVSTYNINSYTARVLDPSNNTSMRVETFATATGTPANQPFMITCMGN